MPTYTSAEMWKMFWLGVGTGVAFSVAVFFFIKVLEG